MKILVACEFSGLVRDEFIAKGHNAISCDLIASERPGPHIIGNVQVLLNQKWDMMLAFPPCTFLANSGVRYLHECPERWHSMYKSIEFFNSLLNSHINKIVIENPIQHRYARQGIRKYDQTIQPWQYGHGETKRTCLWLKNVPPLKPTNIVNERVPRVHWEPPSKDRWKNRSRTYTGIAAAMADQWG